MTLLRKHGTLSHLCKLISRIIIYSATITPYRVCYVNSDDFDTWSYLDYIVDALFLVDIVFEFFTACQLEDESLIMDKKKIAIKYMKGWFWFDFVSVFPFTQILETNDIASISKLARLPRIYKIIKMIRLFRMSRVFKNKTVITKKFKDSHSTKKNLETLIIFFAIFLVCIHVLCCIWYLIADLESDTDNWVFNKGLTSLTSSEIYLISFYYITTTVCTIGYGDFTPTTFYERLFAIVLMIAGILTYSFTVGSLTNLLNSMNRKNARLKDWLNHLNEIKETYNLNYEFYLKLRNALVYENSKSTIDNINFLKLLPKNLNYEVSYIMFKELCGTFNFFKDKSNRFIASVGPNLKPQKIKKSDYIYLENDAFDDIYFLKSGTVSFVLPRYNDLQYLIIEKGSYFGEIDLLNNENEIPKRQFTAKAESDCELLLISINEFYKACIGFENYIENVISLGEKRLIKIKELLDKALDDLKCKDSVLFESCSKLTKMKTKFVNVKKEDDLAVASTCKTLHNIDDEIFLNDMEDKDFSPSPNRREQPKQQRPSPECSKLNSIFKSVKKPQSKYIKWNTLENIKEESTMLSKATTQITNYSNEDVENLETELNCIEHKLNETLESLKFTISTEPDHTNPNRKVTFDVIKENQSEEQQDTMKEEGSKIIYDNKDNNSST